MVACADNPFSVLREQLADPLEQKTPLVVLLSQGVAVLVGPDAGSACVKQVAQMDKVGNRSCLIRDNPQ